MRIENVSGKENETTFANTAVIDDMQKAKDIMMDAVCTVQSDTSIFKAIATMLDRGLTSLPVVDENMKLVGIFSEKDVLELVSNPETDKDTVGDFMIRDVTSFDQEACLVDICDCFIENDFRKVAILNDGKLVSMISRNEIIKANAHKFISSQISADSSESSGTFTARDVMTHGIFTVRQDTSVSEAVEVLIKRGLTALPVVDESMNLMGIVSEKDVLRLLYDPQSDAGVVADIMTADTVQFSPIASLFDICDCLVSNHFRRVIISENDKLVGIISRTDIIKFILTHRTAFLKKN